MVLGDEHFYTIDGQKIDRSVLVQHMIDYFNEKYPDSQITDFNEGSVIRNILESLSVDIFHLEFNNNLLLRQSFITTATGYYLDLFGEEMNTPRLSGLQAQGVVTFSIEEPVNYLISIPQHTRIVDTATGLYYETWTTCEIPIGETSVDCPVYSVVPGAGTNIPSNRDFLFYDQNSFQEVTISNSEAFTGGRDNESDEDYRNRLLEAKNSDGFGSREYYKKLGRVEGVHDIELVDSATRTAKVIVNGYSKTAISDDLLAKVTTQYTNEKNIVYSHSFEVEKAQFTTVDLTIEMTVNDEIPETTLNNIIDNYFCGGVLNANGQQFNSKGCSVNSKISNYEFMTFLETISGVIQVTNLSASANFPLTPSTNKVLRANTISITQNIAE